MNKRCMGCMNEYSEEFEICPYCGFIENSEPESPLHMEPGTYLADRYIVGRVVGYGGFGVTYLALDYQKNTRVAIKEYYPAGLVYRQPGDTKIELLAEKEELFKEGEEKFYSEAKTIAKLRENGNIVTVYEFFKENNTSYFVMEYLEGCDLKGFVAKNGTLSEGQAITVIRSVCGALGDLLIQQLVGIFPGHAVAAGENHIVLCPAHIPQAKLSVPIMPGRIL